MLFMLAMGSPSMFWTSGFMEPSSILKHLTPMRLQMRQFPWIFLAQSRQKMWPQFVMNIWTDALSDGRKPHLLQWTQNILLNLILLLITLMAEIESTNTKCSSTLSSITDLNWNRGNQMFLMKISPSSKFCPNLFTSNWMGKKSPEWIFIENFNNLLCTIRIGFNQCQKN